MRTRRQSFFLILTLGILNALTPFSIDLYLPAFPEIARDLGTAVARMSLTVSVYFIGFALGQIFYGPLLDRFGRKRPIYFGLTLYVLATFGCMTAQSMEAMFFFRFLSALGGCAASVGATAMVRDYFPVRDSARVFSMLMLVLSVSPLLAPTIGGALSAHLGWRALFGILAALGILDVILVAVALPHAYEPDVTVSMRLKPILVNFAAVLKNPQFSVYTFSGAFSFAGLFVYIGGSPAIFLDGFGVSASTYGAIFAGLAVGMIGGGQLNLLLLRKFESTEVFKAALMLQVAFCIVFLGCVLMGACGLIATVAFLFLILTCAGVTSPNSVALSLEPFSKNVGSASSLMGFLRLGVGALTSAGVGLLNVRGTLPTAAVMAVSSVIGLGVLVWRRGPRMERDSAGVIT